jgi:diguanylate cyclase (GGDEF)-like protein/PAS domain S-box-containing protein
MGFGLAMLCQIAKAIGALAIAVGTGDAVGWAIATAPPPTPQHPARASTTHWQRSASPPMAVGIWLGLGGLGGALTTSLATARRQRHPLGAKPASDQAADTLRLLVETADLAYWEIDLVAETIWLLGDFTQPPWPAAAVTLTRDQFLHQYIPPDQGEALYNDFKTAVEAGGLFSLEHQIKGPPGSQPLWVLARGRVLADRTGQPRSVVGVSFNNTAKKQLEYALTASRSQLKDILDNASVALSQLRIFANGTWQYDYFSRGHRWVYGFSEAEFLADPDLWGRRVHPEDLSSIVHPLLKTLTLGPQTATIEVRFQHGDGAWRYIAQTYSSRRDDAQDCWIVVAASHDITRTKQIEIDLRTSEARFQSLATNLPGIIYRYELNPATGHQALTYMSPGAEDIFGHPAEAIMADVNLAWAGVHAEDTASLQQTIAQSLETLSPWQWQGRLVGPDGTTRWVEGRSKPERQPDGTVVWDGFLLNVSERARLEAERIATDLALKAERDLFNGIMSTSVAAIVVLAPDGQILFANRQAEALLGLDLKDLIQRTYNSPDWRATALDGGALEDEQMPFRQIMATGKPVYNIRHAIKWPDGEQRALSINGAPVKDSQGRIISVVFTVSDITDQIQAEQALRDSEVQLRLITDNMSDLVCLHKPDGTYLYVSPSCKAMLGFSPTELIGQSPYHFFHPEDHEALRQGSHQQALAGQTAACTYRIRRKGGDYIWLETLTKPIFDATGQVVRLQTTSRDVTEKVTIQAQLEYDAGHDALTGLPNRALLLQRLDRALAERPQRPCAVLFIDLDRFKVINDSLGHYVGDSLLVAIAHKLRTITRPQDLAARLSGDEFVVLLSDLNGAQQANQVADRLLAELRQPFALDDRKIYVSASIGIALSTARHHTGMDLLRDADIAMYRAKAAGKGSYAEFDPQMHLQVLREMHLEEALRQALEHQELTLHYQPIVHLATGQIKGFEVLARWPHSQYGMISPAEFIPIAEETGLILALGRWVLRTACNQFSQWRQQFPAVQAMELSVNLSAVQLREANLVETMTTLLTHLALPGHCLTLEITESLLIDNVDCHLAVLETLRRQGIQLSIDDFGTGYSSLSYLQRFPFSGLKIDRSFVTHLGTEAENPTLIKSILALAESLKLAPIAEGIETEKQLEFLQANGCRYGQGFLFYRPMPAEQITALLAQGPGAPDSCLLG